MMKKLIYLVSLLVLCSSIQAHEKQPTIPSAPKEPSKIQKLIQKVPEPILIPAIMVGGVLAAQAAFTYSILGGLYIASYFLRPKSS